MEHKGHLADQRKTTTKATYKVEDVNKENVNEVVYRAIKAETTKKEK